MKSVALEVKGMLNSFTIAPSFGTIDSQAGKEKHQTKFPKSDTSTEACHPTTINQFLFRSSRFKCEGLMWH